MFFLLIFIALILILVTVVIINSSYINAIKKAEEEIITSLNEPTLLLDPKLRIIILNQAAEKLIGISTKEALGQHIDNVLRLQEDKAIVPFTVYSESTDINNNLRHTLNLQKKDSEKKQIMVTTSKHALGSDKTLITLLDTSNERQLEEMKVDFVSMAAHELRTPLTAIRGYSSLLQMNYATQLDASAKELLTRLIVSTTNLTNLIDNLLSVSRIERNDLTVEVKPLDLGIIVKDIFSSFETQAKTRNQHFTLNIPDKVPLVMADPFRIGQVFINLIGNAINYTPDRGTITVNVADRSDHLEITVQDNGEGIPEDAMPRLFTKFFRVSSSLEQGSKGTGLGLYITKSIVELHHGKIWAESTLGKGSLFTVTIPIATAEQQTKLKNGNNSFLTVKNGQGIIVRKTV